MSGNGDCYMVAANHAFEQDMILCHGRPVYRGTQTPDPDGRYGHAWVESADGLLVVDKSNGLDVELPRELYYAIGNIIEADVIRFTADEVIDRILTEKTWGPWTSGKAAVQVNEELVRALFADWVDAEASVIAEHSGRITADTRSLISEAVQRAELVGLVWGSDLIPDRVWDTASECEEPRWSPTSELAGGER